MPAVVPRMLFIGGVFLFFSGLIYFLFMAAWLNVFPLARRNRPGHYRGRRSWRSSSR
jgi:hypothetical protein